MKNRETLINRFMTDIPLPEGVYHGLRSFADEFITEVEKHYKAKVIKEIYPLIKDANLPDTYSEPCLEIIADDVVDAIEGLGDE